MDIENKTAATWNSIQETIIEIEQYYMPIFLFLSLLGNFLSVCVFFRTKLRYFSSSIYLGALAVSDTGVLVTVIISKLITHITNEEVWATIFRICIENYFGFISVWLVVTFTVERYVAIKWPLLRRSLCTTARAKVVVIALTGISVFFTIPWFVFFYSFIDNHTQHDNTTTSEISSNEDKNYKSDWLIRIMDMTIMFALPLIMIVVFNTLIVCNIYKQNRVQRNVFQESINSSEQISGNETQMRITKMLVLVSSTFVCLNTPVYIFWFFNDYYITNKPIWLNVAWRITDLLWMMNYGINFVLYYASGHNFRKELIRMFTKC